MNESIETCPICSHPAHASETDDLGRHPECALTLTLHGIGCTRILDVTVRDSNMGRVLRATSDGCGYEWMISTLRVGPITDEIAIPGGGYISGLRAAMERIASTEVK